MSNTIFIGHGRTGMSHIDLRRYIVVNCNGDQTRGESELKQLLERIINDGEETLKQLGRAFDYRDQLLQDLNDIEFQKPIKPESKEPFFRRYERKKRGW